jgi:hypothetical protein
MIRQVVLASRADNGPSAALPGSTPAAMSMATEATDRPAEPSPVPAVTAFAVLAADWNSELSTGVVLPAACAAVHALETCPEISASPTTIESSPEATVNRWAATGAPTRTFSRLATAAGSMPANPETRSVTASMASWKRSASR